MTGVKRLESMALEGEDYRDWYVWAQAEVRYCADRLGCDPGLLADLLAVCSPRVQVRVSIRRAKQVLDLWDRPLEEWSKPPGMLSGTWAAVKHYRLTKEIRGPKTRRFAACLRGDNIAVVLDAWMAKALSVEHKSFATKAGYRKGKDRIWKVAKRLGWRPAEVQAAVWATAWRAEHIQPPATLDVAKHIGLPSDCPF